jgi:hypothetical protein
MERGKTMSTILAWVILFAIGGLILLAIFAQVWDDAKEIGAEQQRRKDFREVNQWKQKAEHPMVFVKELGGEQFVLRRR